MAQRPRQASVADRTRKVHQPTGGRRGQSRSALALVQPEYAYTIDGLPANRGEERDRATRGRCPTASHAVAQRRHACHLRAPMMLVRRQ